MKAEQFLKGALDSYREQISGGGVKIEVPELGMEPFWIFPQQPGEMQYINNDLPPYKDPKLIEVEVDGKIELQADPNEVRNGAEDTAFYYEYCIRLISGRARDEKGIPLFTAKERDKVADFMRTKMPPAFTVGVAIDVSNKILNAYSTTTIEEAEKNLETTMP